jgi:cell division protein FtsB
MTMAIVQELRRQAQQVVVPVLGIALLSYFAYHAIEGERGLFAWMGLNQQLKQTRALADAISAQKHELENRVQRLSSNSLDPDLLDERVRAMLNLARQDDVVIMLPPGAGEASPPNAARN